MARYRSNHLDSASAVGLLLFTAALVPAIGTRDILGATSGGTTCSLSALSAAVAAMDVSNVYDLSVNGDPKATEKVSVGAKVKISCGGDSNGPPAFITCPSTGKWGTVSIPACKSKSAKCSVTATAGVTVKTSSDGRSNVLPALSAANVVSPASTTSVAAGASVTVGCASGYITTSTLTVTCGDGGFWPAGIVVPDCQPDCSTASLSLDANMVEVAATRTFSQTAVTCAAGYTSSDPAATQVTVACAVGGWGPVPATFSCVPDCSDIPAPVSGVQVESTATRTPSTTTISCAVGYLDPAVPEVQLTCVAPVAGSTTASWSTPTTTLSCLPDCSTTDPTPLLGRGQAVVLDDRTAVSIAISCDTGYLPADAAVTSARLSCTAPATWSNLTPASFACIPDCTGATVETTAGQAVTATAISATITCADGWKPTTAVTTVTVACVDPNKWELPASDEIPECIPDCSSAAVDLSQKPGQLEVAGSRKDTATTVACDDGYTSTSDITSATYQCSAPAKWTIASAPLTCMLDCRTAPLDLNPGVVVVEGTLTASAVTITCKRGWAPVADTTLTLTCDAWKQWSAASGFSCTRLDEWASLAAAGSNTCGVRPDGDIHCWGDNSKGQLGTGSAGTAQYGPGAKVKDLPSGVPKSFAVGDSHSCMVTQAGELHCWGSNAYGQLGQGLSGTDLPFSASALLVSNIGGAVAQVAVGTTHTCVLIEGGAVKCWGAHDSGQLGTGQLAPTGTSIIVTAPPADGIMVSDGTIIPMVAKSLTCANQQCCVILTSDRFACWGNNVKAQLGSGSSSPQKQAQPIVATAAATLSVAKIALRYQTTCVLLTDGTVKCVGQSLFYQTGVAQTGTVLQWNTVTLPAGRTATDIYMGNFHSCAILDDGTQACWGQTDTGVLGIDGISCTATTSKVAVAQPTTPLTALGMGKVLAGAAGASHSCVLLETGKAIYCTGKNSVGQVGVAKGVSDECNGKVTTHKWIPFY
mmetsp:Transcript_5439/g.13423  ORF Transcript_5439/g.13423 Transcript_5439/m.13423 type:complete len:983 (-) Transcript_5439:1142-4090(-)|eukprot:CAMPEP_0202863538 /NCGR_PEP_ID=MMETSP1391-20130828/4135_1 /ASSEMBLY_ACC=CAM_ASM_000867 /TAXON_ID=1034604 /ORGANISM="Chlamydomonas leiostraca, Strain SAG 11-49" /LENGTH=982 /DNA_ID=CAMNT_0049543185 /DNA_START=217 /DNA_END=3165 /DNA_ORIENTATION=-